MFVPHIEKFSNQMRKFRKYKKVEAIICYGKRSWDDFKKVFGLSNSNPTIQKNNLEIYDKEKIILVRHFSMGFPDELCEEIIKTLIRWNVLLD